jgi:hypothetical protein
MSEAITSLPIRSAQSEPIFLDISQWNDLAGIKRGFVAGTAPKVTNVIGVGGAPGETVWRMGQRANYFIFEEQLEVSPQFASTAFPKFYTFLLETPSAEDTSKAIQTTGRPAYFISGDYPQLDAGLPNFISAVPHHASGFGELQAIVSAISDRSALLLSDEVEAIIERAAQSHGTPENVQAWAHRLAEDVRNLTD